MRVHVRVRCSSNVEDVTSKHPQMVSELRGRMLQSWKGGDIYSCITEMDFTIHYPKD